MNQHEQPVQILLPTQPVQHPARVAFQLGLAFGAVWAALLLLRYLFMQFLLVQLLLFLHIPLSLVSNGFFYLSFLVFIGISFGAGLLASKRTGQMTTGIFTNLWIFLWGFVASILTNTISYFLIFSHFPSPFLEEILHSLFNYSTIISMISLIAGAVLGALGGLLGRWLWRRKNVLEK
jgi:hypothetical protein